MDLVYVADDEAENRRSGGPRRFDLTWDRASGAVTATEECTQEWNGTCSEMGGVLELVDKDEVVITLTENKEAKPAEAEQPAVKAASMGAVATSLLQSVAKLRYEVEADRASYVAKLLDTKSQAESEATKSDQIVFDATIGEINSISAALHLFDTESCTDPSLHFDDADRIISSIEVLLAHEAKETELCFSKIIADVASPLPVNHIGNALQHTQAALIAISLHEPHKVAPKFVSNYCRLLARFCVRMIDFTKAECASRLEIIHKEGGEDEAAGDDVKAKELELFERATLILKNSCVVSPQLHSLLNSAFPLEKLGIKTGCPAGRDAAPMANRTRLAPMGRHG